jgi:hypothetical protein
MLVSDLAPNSRDLPYHTPGRLHNIRDGVWFRPDKLPNATFFDLCRDWWEFFEQLPSFGEYGSSRIRAGVYKSWHYLEKYHTGSINKCKQDLELREYPKQISED